MTELLTTREVADRLGMHPKTVVDMLHTRELTGTWNGRRGNGARYRVHAVSVEHWIKSHNYRP